MRKRANERECGAVGPRRQDVLTPAAASAGHVLPREVPHVCCPSGRGLPIVPRVLPDVPHRVNAELASALTIPEVHAAPSPRALTAKRVPQEHSVSLGSLQIPTLKTSFSLHVP